MAETIVSSIQQLRSRVGKLISGREPEQLEQALDCLEQWRMLQPQSFEVLQRQLEILLYTGELEHVAEKLRDWAGPRSLYPEFEYFSGVLAQLQGDVSVARQFYANAIREQRKASKLAALDEDAMSVATAIQLCDTAAGSYPGSSGSREDGMFGCETELQLLESALLYWEQGPSRRTASEEVLKIHANAWYNLGCAALASFTADDRRIELFEKANELDPGHLLAQFNRAFAHNYSFSKSPEQIYQAHLKAGTWLESRQPPKQLQPTAKVKHEPRRIRLAYLSSDFRQHSVAHFILPVLQHHNRKRFEVFAYHTHPRVDDFTRRAKKSAEHFRQVARLTDDQLRRQVLSDQIDMLIDLNGLTNGHRLAVLAQRMAPLQLNWMGYPNTTGLKQMDFRIVDNLTDPPSLADPHCTESLIRLQAPFLAFEGPADLPALTPLPSLRNGFITFGSFNALPKLNSPLLRTWAGIMHQVPGSRLLIKNFGMGFNGPRDQIRSIFDEFGIGEDRLIFVGKTTARMEHLKFYEQVDISLDTFPYNGTTTTCDSFVMGVPVVSMTGEDHRSRVGLSLLSSLGLESLVASDQNSLTEIVTALAANPQELERLRAGLRERLMQSRLGDAASLTANLELELIQAWENWQEKTREIHE